MDNNGNAVIVWGGFDYVYKSEYRNGTWTHPADFSEQLNPVGPACRIEPVVVLNDVGSAIIVWYQNDANDNLQTFMSHYY
jgi:hypothetical protein